MPTFYTPDITEPIYVLPQAESKHAIKVLRLNEGAVIQLFDGKGSIYNCEISIADAKRCEVKILTKKFVEPQKPSLHIAIAPTKNNDRFEWFLEKATEIGISEITPLLCQQSERKKIKLERFEKILIAAMKQSKQAYLPKLNELTKFSDFIKNNSSEQQLMAHCEQTDKKQLNTALKLGKNTIILIGPEGDFSKAEIELALKNNFKPVALGNSRLRTETAGIYACAAYNYYVNSPVN
jgi:16S rRNA (uracil1498-N3)-methyltransferase